jgi:hypothetical protein
MLVRYKNGENVLNSIVESIEQIAVRLIFLHGFIRFSEFDNLLQQSRLIIIEAIRTYDPEHVNEDGKRTRAFSYFSNAIRYGLLRYSVGITRKINPVIVSDKVLNFNDIFDTLREHFETCEFDDKYIYMLDLMRDYCNCEGCYGKHKFVKTLKSNGFSKRDIWRFFKLLKTAKNYFFKGDEL